MDGYSGTPLWRKLGLKPDTTAQLLHAPDGWMVQDAPLTVRWLPESSDAPATLIVSFYREPRMFLTELETLAGRIRPAGMMWVAWPRKSTGHTSDMTENLIRDTAIDIGLVDVKVAALDEAWSGLKLVWRLEHR
ncbi:MAG TPA: DUF3052 domain-containing protein [Glaciibacter sp.]|nr:DUF3052 domain-containing protein [Glaciibacter sp.]